jgi:peptide/nickel transport system permease protein
MLGVATLFAVATIVFFGVSALPGNAATAVLGAQVNNKVAVRAKEKALGLDRPVVDRYLSWVGGAVHGDLGVSAASEQPIAGIIGSELRNTAVLALLTMIVLVPLAIGLGVISALKRDTVLDHGVATATLTFLSTPEFVLGSLLAALFAGVLGLLPSVSILNSTEPITSQLKLLVLPVMTLVLVLLAQASRMIRAVTIEVLRSPYVELAVTRGTRWRTIIWRHVLPNVVGSTVQIFALTIAYLSGGVVVTETVFGYPGIGSGLVSAVGARDLPLVTAIVVIVSSAYIVANTAADVINIVLNPRLRRGAS